MYLRRARGSDRCLRRGDPRVARELLVRIWVLGIAAPLLAFSSLHAAGNVKPHYQANVARIRHILDLAESSVNNFEVFPLRSTAVCKKCQCA